MRILTAALFVLMLAASPVQAQMCEEGSNIPCWTKTETGLRVENGTNLESIPAFNYFVWYEFASATNEDVRTLTIGDTFVTFPFIEDPRCDDCFDSNILGNLLSLVQRMRGIKVQAGGAEVSPPLSEGKGIQRELIHDPAKEGSSSPLVAIRITKREGTHVMTARLNLGDEHQIGHAFYIMFGR